MQGSFKLSMLIVASYNVHTIYILMNISEDTASLPTPFFKGISLSEYIKQMEETPNEQIEEDQNSSNDLYALCEKNGHYNSNFAINQIDQDNYDQSQEALHRVELPATIKLAQLPDQANQMKLQYEESPNGRSRSKNEAGRNASNFRIKVQSISPKKKLSASPKKQMFQSLYGQGFITEKKNSLEDSMLSSLGIHSWRLKNKNFLKKQTQFKEKHLKNYQELVRYESVVRNAYNLKLNSIRIDGIKDKMHQRKDNKIKF